MSLTSRPHLRQGFGQFAPCCVVAFVSVFVYAPVLLACHDNDVVRAVVVADSVDMVRVFCSQKSPADQCLSDDPMLSHVASPVVGRECVGVVGLVDVNVTISDTSSNKQMVRGSGWRMTPQGRRCSMSGNESKRVSGEAADVAERGRCDRRRFATSAFASARRDLIWMWDVAPGRWFPSAAVAANESGLVVAGRPRTSGRNHRTTTTSARASGSSHLGVGHGVPLLRERHSQSITFH